MIFSEIKRILSLFFLLNIEDLVDPWNEKFKIPKFIDKYTYFFSFFSTTRETLISTLVLKVNSMLDWSRLKWTNELERIWNVSLSQSALILDTIGEDSIKTG